jgi:uncharacterized YccA/Bax inhibitor family protein
MLLAGMSSFFGMLILILDFNFIENGVRQGVPAFMEWYAAFGLLVFGCI